MKNIAIIGAGIAGLTAANEFTKAGHKVTIYEKSRGPGGRTSTRRNGEERFDHGCPFFTASYPQFIAAVKQWIQADACAVWQGEFINDKQPGTIKYVGTPAMNSICKYLAKNQQVHTAKQVQPIKVDNDKYILLDQDNNILGKYDMVISTAPPEQTKALFADIEPEIKNICKPQMLPMFSVMLQLGSFTPPYAAKFYQHNILGQVIFNNTKPNRGGANNVVIHCAQKYAIDNVDKDKDTLKQAITDAFINDLGSALKIKFSTIHRWLYAKPASTNNQQFYYNPKTRLAIAGDWLYNGDVQSAWLSGYRLAQEIING